jgi:hypothetical protein
MQLCAGSSKGTRWWNVTDEEAMPWIITTTGPLPVSPVTDRSGASRRNNDHGAMPVIMADARDVVGDERRREREKGAG